MKSLSQIKSNITVIRDAGRTLTKLVHESACSIVGHVLLHGDVTLADNLLDAMGEGARKQALVRWFETFGPVSYDSKARKFKVAKGKKADMLTEMAANAWADMLEALDPCIVDADGKPVERWDKYTHEKVSSVWDATDYLDGVIKTLKKHEVADEVIAAIEGAQKACAQMRQLAALEAAMADGE